MKLTLRPKYELFVLLVLSALLSACATGPASPTIAPVKSAAVAPLATKDKPAYTNAIAALEKGDTKDAAVALAKIAEANPGYVDVWVNLALANYTLRRSDEAMRAIEHANRLRPQSADIDNVKGLIYAEQGRYKEAEQLYLTALKLDPKNASAHYNLGLLYDIYYQDIAKAVPHYEHYLSLSHQKDEETEAWTEELKLTLSRRSAQ